MACPKCGCKETYQYDHMEDCMIVADERFERCAACGEVFDIEDAADDDDDKFWGPDGMGTAMSDLGVI